MRTMNNQSPMNYDRDDDALGLHQRLREDAKRIESQTELRRIPHVDLRMLELRNEKRSMRRMEFLFVVLALTSMVVFLILTVAMLFRVPLALGMAVALLVLSFIGGVVALFYTLVQWTNYKEAIPR